MELILVSVTLVCTTLIVLVLGIVVLAKSLRVHQEPPRFWSHPRPDVPWWDWGWERVIIILDELEEKHDVRLTPWAREELIIPIIEVWQYEGRPDYAQLKSSLSDIIKQMKEEQDSLSKSKHIRTTRSVIKALHKKYCRIPPFCGHTDEATSNTER